MIKNYYKNIFLYDFLLKMSLKNIFQLFKITKICLNLGFKDINLNKKKLIKFMLFLKLISNQKIKITNSKKNNIFLKIKKNSIIGCKIVLRKENMYIFLEKLILFIIQNLNIKVNIKNKNILNFQIINFIDFIEFQKEFLKIKELPPLNISIHTNTKNYKELFLFFNFFFLVKKQK